MLSRFSPATGDTVSTIKQKILITLAVAIGYAVLGKLSLFLASGSGYASPVWPSAGLALGAALIYGNWVCIGAVFGSYINNLFLGDAFDLSNHIIGGVIGLGAGAQALLGAFLIRRSVGFPTSLNDISSIGKFFFLGAPVACFVNSVAGVTVLLMMNIISMDQVIQTWAVWWLGDTLGVITFTPVVLALGMKHSVQWGRRKIPITVSLVITLGMTVLMFELAKRSELERATLALEAKAQVASLSLTRSIKESLANLARVSDFIQITGEISRRDFKEFTQDIFKTTPSLHAISWNAHVSSGNKSSFEQKMRDLETPEFRITERSGSGNLVPATSRPEYIAVTYIEPLATNKVALGFDVGSNLTRRMALERARDTDGPVSTERLRLVQGTEEEPAVLVFIPHFEAEPDRKSKLKGYTTGVLRIGNLVEQALSGLNVEDVDIALLDLSAPKKRQLLYPRETLDEYNARILRLTSGAIEFAAVSTTTPIPMPGRDWQIIVRPTPGFIKANSSPNAWFILVGGVGIVALVSILTLITTGRHRLIEELVEQQTADLSSKTLLLERAKQDAERANKAKSDFLSSMSHDLRTPLNAIMGFSDIMRNRTFGELGDPRYGEYADDIHKSGKFLVSLINDILDVSKIEMGKYDLIEDEVDVFDLVQSSVHQLRILADAADISIDFHATPNIPSLRGDERVLIQVLNNLLSNAVKFSYRGGKVNVWTSIDDRNRIVVSVSDNGEGMTQSEIARALEPFTQVNPDYSRRDEGTGLGLHLCTNFMKLFGGTFSLESQVGKGTTATIQFPPERTILTSEI